MAMAMVAIQMGKVKRVAGWRNKVRSESRVKSTG
jgi:hypothetical protein